MLVKEIWGGICRAEEQGEVKEVDDAVILWHFWPLTEGSHGSSYQKLVQEH